MNSTPRFLRIQLLNEDVPLAGESARLLARVLAERAGIEIVRSEQPAELLLCIEPGAGAEGYRIDRAGNTVRIAGNDGQGLLYGVGRFLRSSLSGDGTFTPGAWLGSSRPDCTFRGMYFAHNFHNWYRSAPLPDLIRYVEELALRGMNAIAFPCDTNPHCPVAEIENVMLPKQLELIKASKRLGIRVGMITCANTIPVPPEPEIAAVPVPDTVPERRGNIGNRVCPSCPQGFARLSARFERSLAAYGAAGLDFVAGFPYDEGGCGCERCRPWGGNGFVKACRELSRLAKEKYPGCRFIAGTWCFDVLDKPEGEYELLDRSIRTDGNWCDMIMCDSHHDYPEWPLKYGPPGKLPMINFAEISMWGRYPWGGWGANPYPRRITRVWRQSMHLLSGGLPYSEGCFEDINKAACLSLFWDKNDNPDDIVKEYVRYEFGAAAVAPAAEAIRIMEEIYPLPLRTREKALKVLALVNEAAAGLPDTVLASWRWRILRLRAIIDAEAVKHPGRNDVVSEKQNEAFKELIRIYHAQNAHPAVTPPALPSFGK